MTYEARTIRVADDRFIVVLDYEEDEQVWWVNWRLFSVANVDGEPAWFVGDDGPTTDFGMASVRAEGHVKWDGCHEFQVGDYHGCRPRDLRRFFQAIVAATSTAARLLTQGDRRWSEP